MQSSPHDDDYPQHERGYHGFLKFILIVAIGAAALMIFLAFTVFS